MGAFTTHTPPPNQTKPGQCVSLYYTSLIPPPRRFPLPQKKTAVLSQPPPCKTAAACGILPKARRQWRKRFLPSPLLIPYALLIPAFPVGLCPSLHGTSEHYTHTVAKHTHTQHQKTRACEHSSSRQLPLVQSPHLATLCVDELLP